MNSISEVNVNTVPRKDKIEWGPLQMRVEFWNENDNVYGVNIKFNGLSLTFTDEQNPLTYDQISRAFKDLHGRMEYPRDDNGIEVHILQLVPSERR